MNPYVHAHMFDINYLTVSNSNTEWHNNKNQMKAEKWSHAFYVHTTSEFTTTTPAM
jgi:hypothetical protein